MTSYDVRDRANRGWASSPDQVLAGSNESPGWRHDRPASGVVDHRACRRQGQTGRPVMMSAQQQVSGVVPARCRRHDRDYDWLGRTAASAAGLPQYPPVSGGHGGCGPLAIRRIAANGGRLRELRPHDKRLAHTAARDPGPLLPGSRTEGPGTVWPQVPSSGSIGPVRVGSIASWPQAPGRPIVAVEGKARMRRRLAVVAARATQVVRGLWPDRNPLRRTLDRAEGVILGGLAVAFLAGAPLAAVSAGHAAYSYYARTAHAQQAAWRQVPAVLLATAPTFGYAASEPLVRARWMAPNGTRRTGMVPAPPGEQAGGTVRVWVDATGQQTGPPVQPAQVRAQAVVAAVLAPLVLGMIVLCAGQLANYLLGRRRLAAWEAEWRATEPQWTRHR